MAGGVAGWDSDWGIGCDADDGDGQRVVVVAGRS